ncbi:site-specific integrase [Microbacterium sp.]|uniref:tyrosine-type recombinase/integrase n=1 Tax=Microbacterium sp. TaxID=51671 RepID=UPI0009279DD9|nr:site-specific integrase [Microbacterium sp.]MBN9190985.1 site-specific integrase [Microbacterium sp.]OJU57715.1 MAG: hypothetical protein BGO04_14435 [Microbacterium sp. 70-38]
MNINHRHVPPIGVHLTQDIANRHGRFRARARWSDPTSHERRSYSATFDREGEARTFLKQIQSRTHIASDPLISLADYIAEIGDRYLRGLDPSSTASGYRGSIRVRVLPTLGHLAVRSISAAVIDRTIDRWEGSCSPSTLKNTVSALTRVLDEAVRDEIIAANPARTRARRRTRSSTADFARKIPTLGEVQVLADACRRVHAAYGDFVLLSALLAARVSEVAGLVVSDIDWDNRLVTIARQHFPGSGGLCVKPTKSRHARRVPILKPLEPALRRITEDRERDQPLLRGPRGGVLTTGTLSRATDWTNLVQRLGHPGLRRHDLRHAGATWFANAGVPLHIVRDILGHASIETTKGYLHTDTTELTRAAERTNQHLRWSSYTT